MTIKTALRMGDFFWTFFAVFLILQSTAESRGTKEEKEHTIHSSTAHSHRKSSLQKSIKHRQQNLAQYLQHFLDEWQYLYKMAEDLKHEGNSNGQHEDESHAMPGNEEHHSGNINEHPKYHMKHAPKPEDDEHHHQRMMQTRRSSPHDEHYDKRMNHNYPTHAPGEHHDQRVNQEFLTPTHHDQHQLHRDTGTYVNKQKQTRRGIAENTHEKDHVTRPENSDGEEDGDEELGHSGGGEHSGDHEGQVGKGVHQRHVETHKRKETKEIKQMEKEVHKKNNHGDSHREVKRTSTHEQMVPRRGNAEDTHENDHVTRPENSDGEEDGDEELGHSGGGEHSGDHEGQAGKGVHQRHVETHKRKETKEIKQMEKDVHKKDNHGDSHREKKGIPEMHAIEQMEKESHKTNNSDGHKGIKTHTTDIHHVDHSKMELIHEAEHSKKTRVHSEHIEEVEIEGDIDHDIDEYHGGYHKGYEDEHVEVRYHMDTSHDDDDDDSQGHGDVDSYSYERRRHVREHDGVDLHHGTDRHHERKKHIDDLHNFPLGRGKTHQVDTHSDDDLHHGTVDHLRSSHERNKHEKKRRHIIAREDSHHDRVESSKHHGRRQLIGHVDSSTNERKIRQALDDASIGDVHHRRSSGHEKKMHHNLDDDTHHENVNINSHHLNRDEHHMGTETRDVDDDNDDMHHSTNGHVNTPEIIEHKDAHDRNTIHHKPSHQQLKRRQLVRVREELHSPQQHHRTRRESPSHDDDIYVDDKNKKKKSYTAIFTGDDKLHSDDDGALNEESRKNWEKRERINQLKLEERNWMKQDSQSQPDCGAVADQTFVYDRDNCRLCQCLDGKAVCEVKPKSCRSGKPGNMCPFVNGEMAFEGTPHHDGCNHCVCRKREWICTRLRCHLAQHDYVNYATLTERTKGIERHIDTCMECDREPVTPVCGPDWRTYRSLCHLRFCGNYDFDEVIQGPCSRVNPCENAECDVDEICVPFPRGPCLGTKTRDTIPVVCKQYKCVSKKEECSDVTLAGDAVCGQDGQTYPSECHLLKKSIAFAYRGPCRASCMTANAQVCGTDGITYQSDCHANLLNRHVDYPGACENMVAKPEVVNVDDVSFMYVNRRCRKVLENKRCPHSTCKTTVIPEGSCCPVCGAAVSIRVDRAIASDLLGLYLLRPSTDFTSLETIQSFIRGIQDPQHLRKCRMTIDYTERNDLSVLFATRQPGYITFCQKAAQETMDYINSHSNSSDPIEAMLAAAVAVEMGTTLVNESTRVRRDVNLDLVRIKRGSDHLHDMHEMERDTNSTAADVAPPLRMVFSVGAYIGLYWLIDD